MRLLTQTTFRLSEDKDDNEENDQEVNHRNRAKTVTKVETFTGDILASLKKERSQVPRGTVRSRRQGFFSMQNPEIADHNGSNVVAIFKVENSGLGTKIYTSGSVEATAARQGRGEREAKHFRHGN
ncbi:unnamed protein product [Eruca vesicaria subsp. sativa]|uniref:Uncharacterized protein n=1 Tax=Eruca vesicaria subsp. sativa TaxID=29727 RepID=A0ABC8K7Q5_ERUVS|nr:unnamed protein product [Eruca vesicaria subsp. sativa]